MTQNERIRAARALVNSELVPDFVADMRAQIAETWAHEPDQTKRNELWRRQRALMAIWEELTLVASFPLNGDHLNG